MSLSLEASGCIKIGWDIRAKGAPRPKPQRLGGFILVRNSLDQTNHPIIEQDLMLRLGAKFTADSIGKAIEQGIKAPPGLLPHSLDCIIGTDAIKAEDGTWLFPGTFDEQLACWNKEGLFCFGDGVTAHRKLGDGTRSEIGCRPIGSTAINEKEKVCPYSERRECKPHMRLVVRLIRNAGTKDVPRWGSLADSENATFRLDTSSGYGGQRICDELIRAADRTGGFISGLHGTLTVAVQKKRYSGGVGIGPQLLFTLNEGQIREREAEMRGERTLEAPRTVHAITYQQPAPAIEPTPDYQNGGTDDTEPAETPEPAPEAEIEGAQTDAADPTDERLSPFDAAPELLVAALRVYIQAKADREEIEFGEACALVCRVLHEGKWIGIRKLDDFLEYEDEGQRERRTKALRDICALLLRDNPDGFKLVRVASTEEPAKSGKEAW